jgi:hypothetical protein
MHMLYKYFNNGFVNIWGTVIIFISLYLGYSIENWKLLCRGPHSRGRSLLGIKPGDGGNAQW